MSKWKAHLYRVGTFEEQLDDPPAETYPHRERIEPWLSAVFQSEHLSLLLGSGFTAGISGSVGAAAANMGLVKLKSQSEKQINEHAKKSAEACGRGSPNIEDQIRTANALVAGLQVLEDARASDVEDGINSLLLAFLANILKTERDIRAAFTKGDEKGMYGEALLTSFLLSFASRAVSRERLNLFTTNYDRLVEYGCDIAGLRVVDRFVGGLSPIFRCSRVDIDLHYNPPGIRGEPRYLEGVLKLTKLHGSIDWRWENKELRRYAIPFGAKEGHPDIPESPSKSVMIYPNPAKDIETSEYPYAELFRDFSAALCVPNSVLVTYGYGFGDDHINRIITDMLTIPSTHLVVISYDDAGKRIPKFCDRVGRKAQTSLLIGNHFGDLKTLVEHYLPKPAIDQITWRKAELERRRGMDIKGSTQPGAEVGARIVKPDKENMGGS